MIDRTAYQAIIESVVTGGRYYLCGCHDGIQRVMIERDGTLDEPNYFLRVESVIGKSLVRDKVGRISVMGITDKDFDNLRVQN